MAWDGLMNLISGSGGGVTPGAVKPVDNTIMGMDPNTFSIIAGNMGTAFSGKDSVMGQVGAQAAQLGQGRKMDQVRKDNNATTNQFLMTLLGGGKLTPAGVPGPTSLTLDAAGYKIAGDNPAQAAADGTMTMAGPVAQPTPATPAAMALAPAPGYSPEAVLPFLQALRR